MKISVSIATEAEANSLAPLFAAYIEGSISKKRDVTVNECNEWIRGRTKDHSGIFIIARYESQIVGFATLYSGFDSTQLCRTWTLFDLFVSPNFRSLGVGRQIMGYKEDTVYKKYYRNSKNAL